MVAHNGLCLVHRAEIMMLGGDWESALEEARRSAERFTRGALNQLACGEALLLPGRGASSARRFEAAEEAYRQRASMDVSRSPGWR